LGCIRSKKERQTQIGAMQFSRTNTGILEKIKELKIHLKLTVTVSSSAILTANSQGKPGFSNSDDAWVVSLCS
jgi:hypothetical protein